MLALIGGALLVGGLLATALAARYFRNPKAPRWTRGELVAELVAVILTLPIGLGGGYLMVGVPALFADGPHWLEIAGLGVIALVLVLGWRAFERGRPRMQAGQAVDTMTGLGPPPAPAP